MDSNSSRDIGNAVLTALAQSSGGCVGYTTPLSVFESLDLTSIIMEVEDKFGFRLQTNINRNTLVTVGDLIHAIEQELELQSEGSIR